MKITSEQLSKSYITIQGWMVSELGLSGNELIVYALIFGFSQDGKSEFVGSYNYISGFTGLSRQTAVKVVERLEKRGLIKKIEHPNGGDNTYSAVGSNENVLGNENIPGGNENIPGGNENIPGVVTKVDHLNNNSSLNIYSDNNNINNDINNNTLLSLEFKDLWNSIVTNCQSVRALSDARRKKVLSRIKEMAEVGDVTEVLTTCLRKINDSAFCNGKNDRGWMASFDWFIENGNSWRKVYEGKYDNRTAIDPNKPKEYPDGTYTKEKFTYDEMRELFFDNFPMRQHLLRGYSIQRKNGKWLM